MRKKGWKWKGKSHQVSISKKETGMETVIMPMENKHKRNRTKVNIMNWLKAEFVKRRYGFNSPVLWTSHIRCFSDLRFRENVILTSISFRIGHISQKGLGQDAKSQRGRGDSPGTSAGLWLEWLLVSFRPPLSARPMESFALSPLWTLQTGSSAPVWVGRHHPHRRWGWWGTHAKYT